jgi:hypothetical protein
MKINRKLIRWGVFGPLGALKHRYLVGMTWYLVGMMPKIALRAAEILGISSVSRNLGTLRAVNSQKGSKLLIGVERGMEITQKLNRGDISLRGKVGADFWDTDEIRG